MFRKISSVVKTLIFKRLLETL